MQATEGQRYHCAVISKLSGRLVGGLRQVWIPQYPGSCSTHAAPRPPGTQGHAAPRTLGTQGTLVLQASVRVNDTSVGLLVIQVDQEGRGRVHG